VTLLQAASVIYHEGLPGHHLQISVLAENGALHPIRREQTGLRTFALTGYLGALRVNVRFCRRQSANLCRRLSCSSLAFPRKRLVRRFTSGF
jgi:hypothetical protein